ncbi:MAG TPA: hypothetical protein VF432_15440 [Thermoanaerobaculia bacterium]
MRLLIACCVSAALIGCGASPPPRPSIALNGDAGTIEVSGLDARDLERLRRKPLSKSEWTALLAVHSGSPAEPAMLGSYDVTGDAIVFHPRFPLVRGLTYNVRFDASRLDPAGTPIESAVALPGKTTATTVVAQVYPTAGEVPANQLKFYLDFSAPMSFGDAYRHIRLLDDGGREVPRAFLQTAHELWDARRQRFTLILDPGRIKRGLRSNVENGPPLRAGSAYRLVIDAHWRDGDGNPLRESFEKRFRVIAADRTAPDADRWRLKAPAAETTEPLELAMNEPLDRALLEEMLVVLDGRGQPVEGQMRITAAETRWTFRPHQPWRRGGYAVRVSAKLEDRAGNNLQRLFDEDTSNPPEKSTTPEWVELPFTIAGIGRDR